MFRHIVKKKEKVPSFPGFCIKYCAGLCSTLTVCRFPVSFVAHSCLLCHALHIAQSVSALLDARRSHRHKYGRPHIRAVSPHTLRVSHETAPDFLNGPLTCFFISVFCPQKDDGWRFPSERTGDQELPPTRDLYTSHQTFVGTPNALAIVAVTALFGDNSMRDNLGDSRQRSNMLRLFSGQRDAETC